MSKKHLIIIVLAAFFLASCTTQQAKKNSARSLAIDKSMIVGTWAMTPLHNGIANVVEYSSNGKALLHPFNCAEPGEVDTELSDYTISDDGQSIHVKSPTRAFDLQVLEFTGKTMKLGMSVSDVDLTFSYAKIDRLAPLCVLYDYNKAETARRTPYQKSDFVPAPAIPAHEGMDRYVGTWKDKGFVLLTIVRGPEDNYYLYKASDDEDWNYLYNDVHWVGDALHFQSYTYSAKQELFPFSLHKSQIAVIFQPTVDDEKMRYSKIIDLPIFGKRQIDTIVTRVMD
ncbi:MAG: hypothetical protein JHC61_06035 [Burkholderiaceae bacterium]|jgi:hypothetical protein|nr:hypothetical protein [Burkholderiaceae bacterium]